MTPSNVEGLKRWIGIGLLLLGWLVYGVWFSSSYATRINALEKTIEQKASQKDLERLQEQMDRIEGKLDKVLERGK